MNSLAVIPIGKSGDRNFFAEWNLPADDIVGNIVDFLKPTCDNGFVIVVSALPLPITDLVCTHVGSDSESHVYKSGTRILRFPPQFSGKVGIPESLYVAIKVPGKNHVQTDI